MNSDEETATCRASWRAVWIGGAYFPLAILLAIYAAFNLFAPCILRFADDPSASPFWHDTTFTDGLGGTFSLSGVLHSSWKNGLIVAIVSCAAAQQAVLVAWAVFGLGRWHVRFLTALISAALLYGTMQMRLSAGVGWWKDAFAPFLAMPLALISLAAPLAVSAIWSGRRLRHKCANACVSSAEHFSVANLLWLTTAVAVSITLARWKETLGGDTRAALTHTVLFSLGMLVYSTVYVLPLVWTIMAIRRLSLALCVTVLITPLFGAPFAVAAKADRDWAIQLGMATGLLLTVPCSLLIWRFCCYRLAVVDQICREG